MKIVEWVESLGPRFKLGDEVLMPASMVCYRIAGVYWRWGWCYHLKLRTYGPTHKYIPQPVLRAVPKP